MKEDNLPFLRDSIRYLGFGEGSVLNEQVEKEIQKGVTEFQLRTEAHFDEWSRIEAILHFRRSEQSDMYFFNKYEATLLYDNPIHNRSQTFYIYKGKGVTFKEAFNLLQGRSVNKNLTDSDGEKYNAWLKLSFGERTPNDTNYRTRQFRDQYGYNLEEVLNNYPIRELQNDQLKTSLIQSLKKGNIHLVTFAKASKIEKMYVEACPEFKTIIIYSETTRAAQRPSLPKGHHVNAGASVLFPDPENPSANGEQEEGKNEEQEPPAGGSESLNGSSAKKRSRRPDSL